MKCPKCGTEIRDLADACKVETDHSNPSGSIEIRFNCTDRECDGYGYTFISEDDITFEE